MTSNGSFYLSSAFKMKDVGMAKHCVGLRISRDTAGNYFLDQSLYIQCYWIHSKCRIAIKLPRRVI